VTKEVCNPANTGIIRQIKRSRNPPVTKRDDFVMVNPDSNLNCTKIHITCQKIITVFSGR
jgi:hypothetical protein